MKVRLITPSASSNNNGNEVTALRYARILRRLGHRVTIGQRYKGESCDLLIALHARKSSDSILRFREQHPGSPLVVVLTGTDLYRDIRKNGTARGSLEAASHLVVLQRMGLEEIPSRLRAKARVIYQSAACPSTGIVPPSTYFKVCVVGHLRAEKDPFRAAMAARKLPPPSQIEIVHIGSALDQKIARRALKESRVNPRYRWVGGLVRSKAVRHIATSHIVAITSRIEGSSNVLSEALACSVPVVASRIPGLVGTLGPDYPGYFPTGDTTGLAELLWHAESDSKFYRKLRSACLGLASLVTPEREIKSWRRLLDDVQSAIAR